LAPLMKAMFGVVAAAVSRGRETCLGTTRPAMKATGDDAGFTFLLRKQRRMRRADRSALFIF
jgi:hypothetical protein